MIQALGKYLYLTGSRNDARVLKYHSLLPDRKIMKISNYLGKSPENLPFLDVDMDKDNLLFIDPRAIRIASLREDFNSNKYAKKAVLYMDSFFDIITAAVLKQASTGKVDLHAQDLLKKFKEPNETRLGMSTKSLKGIGGGDVVGKNIWDVLSKNLLALVKIGLLKRVEELSIFVPKVGKDITSDLTTRLIFEVLVEFTQDMMNLYTKLGSSGRQAKNLRAWCLNPNQWIENDFCLPHYNGKPLLLVPREWVRPNPVISREKYFQNGCLTYIQDNYEQTKTKKDIRKIPEYMCNLGNVIKITLQAYEDGENLVDRVLKIMDDKYKVLSVQELSEYLYK